MARSEELRLRIRAEDDASDVLDRVTDQVEELEGEDVEIGVQANVSKVLGDLDKLGQEASAAAVAAEELGRALGPELAAKADMRGVIAELERLGLTADEVAANADQVAAKLREVGTEDLGGRLGQSLGTARGESEKLADSARGANSALANMVGNSAQDLGQFAGVAGSAGVALGQMAEYASDAALGGEGLVSSLKSMASVAGPIAGIAILTQLIGKHFAAVAETDAFNRSRVDSFTDALQDAELSAQELSDALSDADETGIFVRINDETKNVDQSVQALFDTFADFQAQVSKGARGYEDWTAAQLAAAEAAGASRADLILLRNALDDAADGTLKGTSVAAGLATGYEDLIRAATALGAATTGVAAGTEDAAFAQDFYGDALDDTTEATDKSAEAQEQAIETLRQYAVSLAQAQTALLEIADAAGQAEARQGALQDAFDMGNAPLDALGAIRDVDQAVRDLAAWVGETGIPDIFDPADVNADDFLAKIGSLRGPIQEQISAAFASGGPAAAQATADTYVASIVESLGGALTAEQVTTLLGLTDLQAQVDVALNQTALANAQASLSALVGLKGETPYTASIGLALQAGTITPAAAQLLINQQLAGAGVEVPSTLAPPDTAAARAEAEAWAAGNPVTLPTTADTSGASDDVQGFATGALPVATVGVEADPTAAERTTEQFTDERRATTPVTVDATTAAAAAIVLAFLAVARTTTIHVGTSGIPEVAAALANVARGRDAPIDAYLRDYPTNAEILQRIGVVRVPIDTYIRNDARLTGTRD